MVEIETKLKALALQPPPEALREQVLKAVAHRPSEWHRLRRTLEWSTAVLVVVMAWATWFEQGSEEVRRSLRATDYAVYQAEVTRNVETLLPERSNEAIANFIIAQEMDAFVRPFRFRRPPQV